MPWKYPWIFFLTNSLKWQRFCILIENTEKMNCIFFFKILYSKIINDKYERDCMLCASKKPGTDWLYEDPHSLNHCSNNSLKLIFLLVVIHSSLLWIATFVSISCYCPHCAIYTQQYPSWMSTDFCWALVHKQIWHVWHPSMWKEALTYIHYQSANVADPTTNLITPMIKRWDMSTQPQQIPHCLESKWVTVPELKCQFHCDWLWKLSKIVS